MKLQLIFDRPVFTPGPSSQTVSSWPLVSREGNERIIGGSVGHFIDIGSPIIRAPKEQTWDEVMEEVLFEYAEAWKRLATL